MDKQDQILKIVQFLKDNAASKQDLQAVENRLDKRMNSLELRIDSVEQRMATKDELQQVKNDLMTHMDGLIHLHQKLDMELCALRDKTNRLEDQFNQFAVASSSK